MLYIGAGYLCTAAIVCVRVRVRVRKEPHSVVHSVLFSASIFSAHYSLHRCYSQPLDTSPRH